MERRSSAKRGAALLLTMALFATGSAAAGAQTGPPIEAGAAVAAGTASEAYAAYFVGVPASIGGTRGWYAAGNTAFGFRHTVGCRLNRAGRYNFVVSVSTTIWANGARIKGIHFKARLVPGAYGGTSVDDGGTLQHPYNWSDNQTVGFRQGSRAFYNFAVALPRQDALGTWDLEVKFKFPRSLRTAYRYKFRVPFQEIDCYGGPTA